MILCPTACFAVVNSGKTQNNIQEKSCWFPFICQKSAKDVIILAKKEFDNFNYEKAIGLYKEAMRLDPSYAESSYLLSYNLSDKYKNAIGALNKTIEIDPNNGSAYYNRGFAYYKLKKQKRQNRIFKRQLKSTNPFILMK